MCTDHMHISYSTPMNMWIHEYLYELNMWISESLYKAHTYGVATISRLLKIISLFCKRDL